MSLREFNAKDGLQMFILGISLMEVGYALACLIKAEASRRKLLYWVSATTWGFIFLSTILSIIAADHRGSPYLSVSTRNAIGQTAYLAICLAEIGLMGIACFRFYSFETQSPLWFRMGMLTLGSLGVLVSSFVYIGIVINFPVLSNDWPAWVGATLNSIGRLCQMVFFVTSNCLFLYRLIVAFNITVKEALWELFFVHEGLRMVIVTVLHIVYIAGTLIWSFAYNNTPPPGPSLAYIPVAISSVFLQLVAAMEFTVFYQLSYGVSRAFVDKFSRSYLSFSTSGETSTTKSFQQSRGITSSFISSLRPKSSSWVNERRARETSHQTVVISNNDVAEV